VSSVNLTHHFLIAMPSMADPYFSKTLTYICEHNDQGALGLVVNRPIDMTLKALQDAHIDRVLRHFLGNKTLAAKSLGVNVKTVYNRVKRQTNLDEDTTDRARRTSPTV